MSAESDQPDDLATTEAENGATADSADDATADDATADDATADDATADDATTDDATVQPDTDAEAAQNAHILQAAEAFERGDFWATRHLLDELGRSKAASLAFAESVTSTPALSPHARLRIGLDDADVLLGGDRAIWLKLIL